MKTDAWKVIYQQYYQTLCYFAFGYLRQKEQAEDVVQGVFTKLIAEGPAPLEDEAHLRHFLYKSVANACLNERKALARHTRILEGIGQESGLAPSDDLFHHIVRSEIYRRIMNAVNELPEKTAEVFKLAYFEQQSNQEIADQMQISINTVKVHKNNAKKTLRELLKDLYPLAFLFLRHFF